MSRTNRGGGSRRGGRYEHGIKNTSTSSETSSANINPVGMGPVRILQSNKTKRVEDDDVRSNVSNPVGSLKSPVPRIATRVDSKPKTENEEKSATPVPSQGIPSISSMGYSIRLFEEYPHTVFNRAFLDYLMSGASDFHVVGIVGAQGTGKSTFASMLGGNEPGDMYGDYIFRPSPREFVEKGASQTLSINVYVSKSRLIIFDCQAINSGHLLEYGIRISKRESSKHHIVKSADEEYDSDTQKYLVFLMEVCHTIILGIDWFMDINIIRELMKSQLISQQTSQKKVNLVVAQMRARSVDFNPKKVFQRSKILRGIFEESKFDILGGLSMKNLGFPIYEKADSEVNYLIFAEIKPRLKTEPGFKTDNDDVYGSFTIPFSELMEKFRIALLNLPKKNFESKTGILTEKEWFQGVAQPAWEKLLLMDLNFPRNQLGRN
ncbi:hypothetical protein FO519_005329 [Halicephalobus sp. NKZ332]|nr:hypothetical protein FO519_005329 [Halicephalobus sp. NKZ332]